MIKLVLLAGFLGAGKTTLMKRIIQEYENVKIGLIINEFGEINIDSRSIGDKGMRITELSNGSIFCACIKDKFIDSLIEMSCLEPEYLFIEASGLADPSNISEILKGIRHKLKVPYDYKGSVCLIDGKNFMDLVEVFPAITSQLEYSSAVIINKEDLIEEKVLWEIKDKIKDINNQVDPMSTSYCNVDIKFIIEYLTDKRKESRATLNTVEKRPTTVVISGSNPVPFDNIKSFVEEIAESTYRIKGFALTDMGNFEISTVGININITPWYNELEKTELVAFSRVGFKLIGNITKAIDRHVKGYIHI